MIEDFGNSRFGGVVGMEVRLESLKIELEEMEIVFGDEF